MCARAERGETPLRANPDLTLVSASMCAVRSINTLAAGLLLLCSIGPLYSESERSYRNPHEVGDLVHRQSRPTRSGASPLEERLDFVREPHHEYYNIYNRNYEYNLVQPRAPTKDIRSESARTRNAIKSLPRYPDAKEESFNAVSQRVESRETLIREKSDRRPSRLNYDAARRKDEEVMRRMNALDKMLAEDTDKSDVESNNTIEDKMPGIPEEAKRVVRQVRRQRPGFFWTLARLAFETFNDTRSAIQQISNLINENFESDSTTRRPARGKSLAVTNRINTTTTPPLDDQSNMSSNLAGVNVTDSATTASTTTTTAATTTAATTTTTKRAPFKFTRNGFQDLIMKNIRGLVRLFNIEWQDAMKQSEVNTRQFQKDLGNQIGGFLRDNPNAF